MAIRTVCPGCETAFNLPDHLRGKKVSCKKCQQQFVVGGDAASAAPASRPGQAARTPGPAKARPEPDLDVPMELEFDDEPKESPPPHKPAPKKGRVIFDDEDKAQEVEESAPPPRRRAASRRDEEVEAHEEAAVPRPGKKPVKSSRKGLLLTLIIGGVVLLGGGGFGLWWFLSGKGSSGPSRVPPVAPDHLLQEVAEQIPVEPRAGEVAPTRVLVSDAHQVVVYYEKPHENPRHRFVRYDCANHTKIGDAIPFAGKGIGQLRAMQLSPDGTRVAVLVSDTEVSIMSMDDGKLVWENFDTKGARFQNEPPGPSGKRVCFLAFVDANRLLVVHEQRVVALWDIAKNQQLFCVDPPVAGNPWVRHNDRLAINVALSPDRKTLALANGRGFDFFDTDKGKYAGATAINPPEENLMILGVAFSPDSKHLAAMTRGGPKTRLYQWEVATQKPAGEFISGDNILWTEGMTWWSPEVILVWNGAMAEALVVNASSGKITHVLKHLGNGYFNPGVMDGRIWRVGDQPGPQGHEATQAYLTALDPLSSKVLEAQPKSTNVVAKVPELFVTPDGVEDQGR
jgi:hypothetical protein